MEGTSYKAGMLLALGAAVCFALSNTFASMAYDGGTTPFTLTVTRFFVPVVALLIILGVSKSGLLLPRRPGMVAVMLGVLTVIYTLGLLNAIERLPVPIAVLIFYLFPILTGFILGLTGWGKISGTMIIGALVAFAGLALALGVKFEDLDGVGMIMAAVGALGLAAVSAVSNRLMVGQDPRQATLYIAATAVIIMSVVALVRGEFTLPETPSGWTGFALTNGFYAIAMISYFYAISLSGAARTTFFSNLEPLVVTGAAFLFLGQSLVPLQLLGVAIVVGSLIFVGKSKPGDAA